MNFKKCAEHSPPPTIKWGIAADRRWCEECKSFIQLRVDMTGHP